MNQRNQRSRLKRERIPVLGHYLVVALGLILMMPFSMYSQTSKRGSGNSQVFMLVYANAGWSEIVDDYDRGYQNGRLFDVPSELVNHDQFRSMRNLENTMQIRAAIVSRIDGNRCVVISLKHKLEEIPYHDPVTKTLMMRRSWLWNIVPAYDQSHGTCIHYLTDDGSITSPKQCGNPHCLVMNIRDGLQRLAQNAELDQRVSSMLERGQVPTRFRFRDQKDRKGLWISQQEIGILSDVVSVARGIWDTLKVYEKTQKLLLHGSPQILALRKEQEDPRGVVTRYEESTEEALISVFEPEWLFTGADPHYLQDLPEPNIGNPIHLARQLFFHRAQAGGAAAVMQQVLDSDRPTYRTFAAELRRRSDALKRERDVLEEKMKFLQETLSTSIVTRAKVTDVIGLNDIRRDETTNTEQYLRRYETHRSLGKDQQPDPAALHVTGDSQKRFNVKSARGYAYAQHGVSGPSAAFTAWEATRVTNVFEDIVQKATGYNSYTLNKIKDDLKTRFQGSLYNPLADKTAIEYTLCSSIDSLADRLQAEMADVCNIQLEVIDLMKSILFIQESLSTPSDSILVFRRTYEDTNYIEVAYDVLLNNSNPRRDGFYEELLDQLEDQLEDLTDEKYASTTSYMLMKRLYERYQKMGSEIAVGEDLDDFNEAYLERRAEQAGYDDLEDYLGTFKPGLRISTDSVVMVPIHSVSIDEVDRRIRSALSSIQQKLRPRIDAINKLLGGGEHRNGLYNRLIERYSAYSTGVDWLEANPLMLNARHWIVPATALRTNILTPILDNAPSDMQEYSLSGGTARNYVEQPEVARSIVEHPMLVPAWESLQIRQHHSGTAPKYSFVVDIRRGDRLYGCYNWLTDLTHCPVLYGGYGSYDEGLSRQYRFEFQWNPVTHVVEVTRVDHLFPMR